MSIDPIRGIGPKHELAKSAKVTPQEPAAIQAKWSDSLELSDLAKALGVLNRLPEIRTDKVDHIKEQVEQGSY